VLAGGRATAGAADLEVAVVQGDGLPVEVALRLERSNPYELVSMQRTGVLGRTTFRGLSDGAYVVRADWYGELWAPQAAEVSIVRGESARLALTVRPRIDFRSLDDDYKGPWSVRIEWTSGWGDHGAIEIRGFISTAGVQPTGAVFEPPYQPTEPKWIELDPDEADRLLATMKQAKLFGGGHVGTNTTSSDGPFDTLRVSNGSATAVLVVSGNPSFATGARRELLRLLTELRARLDGTLARDALPPAPAGS
jgi:hypothetical protein